MEDGLKARKKIMVEADLEKLYKRNKKEKSKPRGINTIGNKEKRTRKKIDFEITVKEQGKLVYQNKSHAGVVCLVESIEDIDEFGAVDGQVQNFIFGHALSYWFAFDQLKRNMEARGVEITTAIQDAIMKKKFVDPEVKEAVIKSMQ